jgi:hypothetical protein
MLVPYRELVTLMMTSILTAKVKKKKSKAFHATGREGL